MYRPLPEGLKIQNSGINGQGLFTMVFLKRDTDLGMSHFVINDNYKDKPKSEISDDDQIRTPLGGFLNHSNDPNCIIIKKGNHSLSRKSDLKKISTELYHMIKNLEF